MIEGNRHTAPVPLDIIQSEEQKSNENVFISFCRNFSAGVLSIAVSKTCVAPIDRVKLILQVQHIDPRITPDKQYKGIIDCFRRIYYEEGFFAFWRGNLANIVRFIPNLGLNFAIKDVYRDWFVGNTPPSETFRYSLMCLISGASAGATTLLLAYPLDFTRTRLATDIGKAETRKYKGILHCLQHTVKTDGFFGLYRGFVPAFAEMTLFRSFYFGGYDSITEILKEKDHPSLMTNKGELSLKTRFAIANFVTIVAGCLVYPLDTVRRRMVSQTGLPKVLYSNSIDCFFKIIEQEGTLGLYRGLGANMLRGVGAALVLVLYDDFKNLFKTS